MSRCSVVHQGEKLVVGLAAVGHSVASGCGPNTQVTP